MPQTFKEKFGDTITVVIDCFELGIERSSNPEASCQTYSHYKNADTVKVLIGIASQRSIIYNSVGYGGRSSDKFVTEDSGFLDKLREGEVVMADRGFFIQKQLQEHGATLHSLAFTKGNTQLHPLDIERTRQIAHVRIHVESCIGMYREKDKIFLINKPAMSTVSKKVHECDVFVVDQMITVCSALINLCSPYIKQNG